MSDRKKDLTKGSIKEHILAIAVPASIGFFFQTMYNVVDTFYAGLLSTQAQAALSLSFPIFFIIIAMGSGIGIAASTLIANALGEKKEPQKYCSQSISYGLIISILIALIGFVISPFLFTLLGAQQEYLKTSLDYMNVILYAAPLFILVMVVNQSLTAQGDSKSFRNVLIVGFFLNLLLPRRFLKNHQFHLLQKKQKKLFCILKFL